MHNLDDRYPRAVAVCGEVVLMSASNGPRGGTPPCTAAGSAAGAFVRCVVGSPHRSTTTSTPYCLDALPDGSFAAFGTAGGSVYRSTDPGERWDALASGLRPVLRVLVMP